MATVGDIAREVAASIATDNAYLLSLTWIQNRYNEMVSRVRFRHLRKVGELSLRAAYNTGTVSVTRGSATVTGVGTVWTPFLTLTPGSYYYFRTSTAWYQISSFDNITQLTLDTAFAEEDVSGGSYYIVQRNYPLPSTVRQIGDFAHDRLRRAFSPISLIEMDTAYRSRILIGPGPAAVAQVGTDALGNVMIEVYPPSETTEMLRYVYWELPSTFTPTTTIPPQIDSYVLKEGVLIDAYRYMMSLAGQSGDATMFASWRNEMRAQTTSWEKRIQDAIRTDRGAFDSTVATLDWKHQNKGAAFRDNPIDGYDIVLNRWSYQYV